MWVTAVYQPVATFSLRPSNTTSSGGKTLVCPTPYAVKMALLDRLIRTSGLDAAVDHFEEIRDLGIWLRLPEVAAVNRTFGRILRPQKSVFSDETGRMEVWKHTIVQREFCLYDGDFVLAFDAREHIGRLMPGLLSGINYFGQRGSFMQLVDWAVDDEAAPVDSDFTCLSREGQAVGGLQFGFLQRMDDMRPDAEFADVDAVMGRARGDGGRISYTVIVPYHLRAHGPDYTVYTYEDVRLL